MAKSARRQYRTAQQSPKHRFSKGLFAPSARRPKVIAALICAALFIFFDGLLAGWFLGKNRQK